MPSSNRRPATRARTAVRILCGSGGGGRIFEICFVVGANGGWGSLANLVLDCMGPALVSELGDTVGVSIHVTEAGQAQGELTVRSEVMSDTVSLLLTLSADWQPRAAYQTCECSCDTSYTANRPQISRRFYS